MEYDSGDDSQVHELNEEEENILNTPITDEFFSELCTAANLTVKQLQSEQHYNLAEDMQKLIMVCQNLKSSLTSEKDRCKLMQNQVETAVGKVAGAFEISQTDQDTIERLKTEIETIWKQADAAQIREQSAQEQLFEIQMKFEKLQTEMKKSDKRDVSDELGVTFAKHKDNILRERDRLNGEVEELKRRLQMQRIYADEMEKKRVESETKIKELYKLIDESSSEAIREKRLWEQLKVDYDELTKLKSELVDELDLYKIQSEKSNKTATQLNYKLASTSVKLEEKTNTLNATVAKLTKATTELELISQHRDKIQIELAKNNNLLKLKESDSKRLSKDNTKLMKEKETIYRRLGVAESGKSECFLVVERLKKDVFTLDKEKETMKKVADQLKKEKDEIIRDRDLVRKELMKTNRIIGEQAENIHLIEQLAKTLANENKQHLIAAQKQKSLMSKIEKERDRNAEEIQILTDKVEQVQDELQIKIGQYIELKATIDEMNKKIVQVQQEFEVARSERNAFQRDLHATIEDRDDVKNRLRIANGKIEQLKDGLDAKESELLKANKEIDNLEKDKIALKLEVQNLNVILQHTRTELKEKKIENERLYKTLSDDEKKIMELKKTLDNTLNEKDLIGTQMVRRNDEIGLLNEKMQIVQMALDRGEAQYNKRLDDIRLLKIEICNLMSQRNLLTRGLTNTADMKQEVLQLNRVLTQERVRSKTLEQDLITPMNVHRWRKLSGKDPDKMDLIEKVQALQKRILQQSAKAIQKDNSMAEAQKLYNSLKQFMAKLPNYTVKEQLLTTKRVLTAETKKLKAARAEIYVNDRIEKRNQSKLEELNRMLLQAKKDLLKEKKEKVALREKLAMIQHGSTMAMVTIKHETIGAGYKVPEVVTNMVDC